MTSRSPDSTVYHVAILNEEGTSPIQEGSLETTPTSLIYTEETSLTRYSWPLRQIRHFELQGESLFIIEGGKLSLSGVGTYSFSTPHARQIYAVVSRNMAALPPATPTSPPVAPPPMHHRHATPTRQYQQQQQHMPAAAAVGCLPQTTPTSQQATPHATHSNQYNEPSPVHWRLNTSVSSDSSNQSPVHSRSSSLVSNSGSCFEVERVQHHQQHPQKGAEFGTLEVTNGSVIYIEGIGGGNCGGRSFQWPIEYLRRYGNDGGEIFTLETGRRCMGGPGLYMFRTPRAAEISAAVKMLSSAGGGGGHGMSPSPTTDAKTQTPPPPLPPP